jgi:hypothetical protein
MRTIASAVSASVWLFAARAIAGNENGAVYKSPLPGNDLKVPEMGAPINARMGRNTWAAFTGTNDKGHSRDSPLERGHAGPEGCDCVPPVDRAMG